eukprot:2893839-Amphidinium_carterae.1
MSILLFFFWGSLGSHDCLVPTNVSIGLSEASRISSLRVVGCSDWIANGWTCVQLFGVVSPNSLRRQMHGECPASRQNPQP